MLYHFLGFCDMENQKLLFFTIFRGTQSPSSIAQRGLELPSPQVVGAYETVKSIN